MRKVNPDAVECPRCHSEMWNPCEPGCCSALYCKSCDVVFRLRETTPDDAMHYKTLSCEDCLDAMGQEGGGMCQKHTAEQVAINAKAMDRVVDATWNALVDLMKAEAGATPWRAWRMFLRGRDGSAN